MDGVLFRLLDAHVVSGIVGGFSLLFLALTGTKLLWGALA